MEAEANAPACLGFPYEHHVKLRTDNVQQRFNRELKRRGRIMRICPGRRPPSGRMGAVLSEVDEDWAGRRRFNDDSIGRPVEGAEVNTP